mgnify:CR=1 FL=1
MSNQFVCILIVLSSLINFSFKEPKYCKLSDKILNEYSKELKQQKEMILIGHGGAMMNDIQEVCMHYISYDRLSVEEARKLYINLANGLLEKYNADEKIRPYLHNFPFSYNNLDIMIAFEDKLSRRRLDDGSVALIFVAKDNLFYDGYDSTTDKLYTLYKEPYAKAVEIVKQQSGIK